MEQIEKLIRVRRVEVVDGLAVRIEFEDSTVKLLDLEPLMHGPIFDELVHDSALFNQITVEHGTITWPNATPWKWARCTPTSDSRPAPSSPVGAP